RRERHRLRLTGRKSDGPLEGERSGRGPARAIREPHGAGYVDRPAAGVAHQGGEIGLALRRLVPGDRGDREPGRRQAAPADREVDPDPGPVDLLDGDAVSLPHHGGLLHPDHAVVLAARGNLRNLDRDQIHDRLLRPEDNLWMRYLNPGRQFAPGVT